MKRRYCPMCDEWFPLNKTECPACGMDLEIGEQEPARLSRTERLQGLADSGCDTWAEHREER